MKLTKKHHLVWDADTKEILVDYEATNPATVTEFTRSGLEGAEFDDKEKKDKEIKDKGLKVKEEPEVTP